MSWLRFWRVPDTSELTLGICVGGIEHGKLYPRGRHPVQTVLAQRRHIETDGHGGTVEMPVVDTRYTWGHVEAGARRFHVWFADNGDAPSAKRDDAIVTLLEASASERAAAQCLPTHSCQLTSGGGVVR